MSNAVIINIREECSKYASSITSSTHGSLFLDTVVFKETVRALIALDLEKTLKDKSNKSIDVNDLMYSLKGFVTDNMLDREGYDLDKLSEDIFYRLNSINVCLDLKEVGKAVRGSNLVRTYETKLSI